MNVLSAFIWGVVATTVLTGTMAAAQGFGFSRMSIPFLLGTIVTPDRFRANLYGVALHFLTGLSFAFTYALAFELLGRADWWSGAALGATQGIFLLAVLLPLLPDFHPRVASEQEGPISTTGVEPPGFLGLNYGRRTPAVTLVAHVAYGTILGALYQVA